MFRPMIKNEYRPVRLGGAVGLGAIGPRIADPDGWVWALLDLLDGTMAVDRIVAELARRFPARPVDDVHAEVHADLTELADAGYVEDAAGLASAGDRDRRALWPWTNRDPCSSTEDIQTRLGRARVVVVGAGGVGSAAALTLASSGVGELHVVDPGVVRRSSLSDHVLVTERDVGRPKAEVAVQRLRGHNSGIAVTGQAMTITGSAVLAVLAARFDVVVLATGRARQIRSWANRACAATGTPWVHGRVHRDCHGQRATVGLYRPGTGPCYDCASVTDQPDRPLAAAGQARANAVSAGIAGQFVAHAAMSLITRSPWLPVNREYGFDLATMRPGTARPLSTLCPDCTDCPACGPRGHVAS